MTLETIVARGAQAIPHFCFFLIPYLVSGQAPSTQTGTTDTCQQPEMRGEWNSGPGMKVARTEKGELNLTVDVYHSPVNSTFGFYTGQLTDPDRYGWPNRVLFETVL